MGGSEWVEFGDVFDWESGGVVANQCRFSPCKVRKLRVVVVPLLVLAMVLVGILKPWLVVKRRTLFDKGPDFRTTDHLSPRVRVRQVDR